MMTIRRAGTLCNPRHGEEGHFQQLLGKLRALRALCETPALCDDGDIRSANGAWPTGDELLRLFERTGKGTASAAKKRAAHVRALLDTFELEVLVRNFRSVQKEPRQLQLLDDATRRLIFLALRLCSLVQTALLPELQQATTQLEQGDFEHVRHELDVAVKQTVERALHFTFLSQFPAALRYALPLFADESIQLHSMLAAYVLSQDAAELRSMSALVASAMRAPGSAEDILALWRSLIRLLVRFDGSSQASTANVDIWFCFLRTAIRSFRDRNLLQDAFVILDFEMMDGYSSANFAKSPSSFNNSNLVVETLLRRYYTLWQRTNHVPAMRQSHDENDVLYRVHPEDFALLVSMLRGLRNASTRDRARGFGLVSHMVSCVLAMRPELRFPQSRRGFLSCVAAIVSNENFIGGTIMIIEQWWRTGKETLMLAGKALMEDCFLQGPHWSQSEILNFVLSRMFKFDFKDAHSSCDWSIAGPCGAVLLSLCSKQLSSISQHVSLIERFLFASCLRERDSDNLLREEMDMEDWDELSAMRHVLRSLRPLLLANKTLLSTLEIRLRKLAHMSALYFDLAAVAGFSELLALGGVTSSTVPSEISITLKKNLNNFSSKDGDRVTRFALACLLDTMVDANSQTHQKAGGASASSSTSKSRCGPLCGKEGAHSEQIVADLVRLFASILRKENEKVSDMNSIVKLDRSFAYLPVSFSPGLTSLILQVAYSCPHAATAHRHILNVSEHCLSIRHVLTCFGISTAGNSPREFKSLHACLVFCLEWLAGLTPHLPNQKQLFSGYPAVNDIACMALFFAQLEKASITAVPSLLYVCALLANQLENGCVAAYVPPYVSTSVRSIPVTQDTYGLHVDLVTRIIDALLAVSSALLESCDLHRGQYLNMYYVAPLMQILRRFCNGRLSRDQRHTMASLCLQTMVYTERRLRYLKDLGETTKVNLPPSQDGEADWCAVAARYVLEVDISSLRAKKTGTSSALSLSLEPTWLSQAREESLAWLSMLCGQEACPRDGACHLEVCVGSFSVDVCQALSANVFDHHNHEKFTPSSHACKRSTPRQATLSDSRFVAAWTASCFVFDMRSSSSCSAKMARAYTELILRHLKKSASMGTEADRVADAIACVFQNVLTACVITDAQVLQCALRVLLFSSEPTFALEACRSIIDSCKLADAERTMRSVRRSDDSDASEGEHAHSSTGKLRTGVNEFDDEILEWAEELDMGIASSDRAAAPDQEKVVGGEARDSSAIRNTVRDMGLLRSEHVRQMALCVAFDVISNCVVTDLIGLPRNDLRVRHGKELSNVLGRRDVGRRNDVCWKIVLQILTGLFQHENEVLTAATRRKGPAKAQLRKSKARKTGRSASAWIGSRQKALKVVLPPQAWLTLEGVVVRLGLFGEDVCALILRATKEAKNWESPTMSTAELILSATEHLANMAAVCSLFSGTGEDTVSRFEHSMPRLRGALLRLGSRLCLAAAELACQKDFVDGLSAQLGRTRCASLLALLEAVKNGSDQWKLVYGAHVEVDAEDPQMDEPAASHNAPTSGSDESDAGNLRKARKRKRRHVSTRHEYIRACLESDGHSSEDEYEDLEDFLVPNDVDIRTLEGLEPDASSP
ncbi:hypothetical protein FVE85_5417 [Porphyridium purpureum]|uniref:Uncharacterized protein n=1 Tax=Porphyridium purpureum TaxID=35688 RepID=A0A5J4Z3W3_PORPP|nr:hypothetical protein FVE85_5417 [Porphyridium purpureum]|eukprot:POR1302..scf295_1